MESAGGEFLSLEIRSKVLQNQIDRKKTQTAQANIFQGKIKTLLFPITPLAEQRETLRAASGLLNWTERIALSIECALTSNESLDQSILAKAFRSELVPQDPNDEPAEDLLARIQATRQSTPAEMGNSTSSTGTQTRHILSRYLASSWAANRGGSSPPRSARILSVRISVPIISPSATAFAPWRTGSPRRQKQPAMSHRRGALHIRSHQPQK